MIISQTLQIQKVILIMVYFVQPRGILKLLKIILKLQHFIILGIKTFLNKIIVRRLFKK